MKVRRRENHSVIPDLHVVANRQGFQRDNRVKTSSDRKADPLQMEQARFLPWKGIPLCKQAMQNGASKRRNKKQNHKRQKVNELCLAVGLLGRSRLDVPLPRWLVQLRGGAAWDEARPHGHS